MVVETLELLFASEKGHTTGHDKAGKSTMWLIRANRESNVYVSAFLLGQIQFKTEMGVFPNTVLGPWKLE